MGDSFFADSKKRYLSRSKAKKHKKTQTVSKSHHIPSDGEITSESELDQKLSELEDSETDSEEEFVTETAADKRRRLANQYLENLREEIGQNDFDASDLDHDNIAQRLEDDVLEEKGKIYRHPNLIFGGYSRVHKTRYFPIGVNVYWPYVYTVGKDVELVKWDLSDPKAKPRQLKCVYGNRKETHNAFDPQKDYKGHIDDILCVAVSPDGKHVVTGSKDKTIVVWSSEKLIPIHVFHTRNPKGYVNSIVFRRNSNTFYAACADLKVRSFSLDQMSQIETLFGHQDTVADISALGQERCITVGSRDRTAILWKIPEEIRLTFRGGDLKGFPECSIDVCALLDSQYFVTGSDNGSISLWSLSKKKPLFIYREAHGLDNTPINHTTEKIAHNIPPPSSQPRYITAIAAIPFSDTFFTGSWDGYIRCWKLNENMRSFSEIGSLPNVKGVVNKLVISESGKKGKETFYVIGAVSKQLRNTRYLSIPGRNGIYVGIVKQEN